MKTTGNVVVVIPVRKSMKLVVWHRSNMLTILAYATIRNNTLTPETLSQ